MPIDIICTRFVLCCALLWLDADRYNMHTVRALMWLDADRYNMHTVRVLMWLDADWYNMHTVCALLCFGVVRCRSIYPYPSGLLHWHCGNLTIAPVPVKQPWRIWAYILFDFNMDYCITTKKQSTTQPCAYFMGYTAQTTDLVIQNRCSAQYKLSTSVDRSGYGSGVPNQ